MSVHYRLLAYVVGVLAALTVSGIFFRSKAKPLSYWMGTAMIAWAFNCIVMLVLLWFDYALETRPPARDFLMIVNATMLGGCPLAILVWMKRKGGD